MNPILENELVSLRQRLAGLRIEIKHAQEEHDILNFQIFAGNRDPILFEEQEAIWLILNSLRIEHEAISSKLAVCERVGIRAYRKIYLPSQEQLGCDRFNEAQDIDRKPTQQYSAPRVASYLISKLISDCDRDSVLGDLNEEFFEKLRATGYLKASLWYYRQGFSSLHLTLYHLRRQSSQAFFHKTITLASSCLVIATIVGAIFAVGYMQRLQAEINQVENLSRQWDQRYENKRQAAISADRKYQETEAQLAEQLRALKTWLKEAEEQRQKYEQDSAAIRFLWGH